MVQIPSVAIGLLGSVNTNEEQSVCDFCKSKGFTTCLRTYGTTTELAFIRSVPAVVEGVVKGEYINRLQYVCSQEFLLRRGVCL